VAWPIRAAEKKKKHAKNVNKDFIIRWFKDDEMYKHSSDYLKGNSDEKKRASFPSPPILARSLFLGKP
jgi:hypothetical protein